MSGKKGLKGPLALGLAVLLCLLFALVLYLPGAASAAAAPTGSASAPDSAAEI